MVGCPLIIMVVLRLKDCCNQTGLMGQQFHTIYSEKRLETWLLDEPSETESSDEVEWNEDSDDSDYEYDVY